MEKPYIATKYAVSAGVGVSSERLLSFDKALINANVGNYNLVRLSSILPAGCKQVPIDDIQDHIQEGSLLPTAYATISSSTVGTRIASAIGIGFPKDKSKVGVIMEYSGVGIDGKTAQEIVLQMIEEAFEERGWVLSFTQTCCVDAIVENEGETVTTFACVAEW